MINPESSTNMDHLQLLRDEKVFISILENLNSGVALIDDQGRFISYNKKFLHLFGLAEQSTIKNVNDQNWGLWTVYNEDLEILHVDEHPVRKAAITGKRVSNQLCGVKLPSGGDIIWMLISAEPVYNDEGRIIKTICTYLDVTEHKLADAALRRSEAELRELNATKDKLFSIISHDLKGPFSSIVGFSELLLEKIEKNDLKSIKDYSKIILDSSWHAVDLLTNLIEWSRLQTGKMSFTPEATGFLSILDGVLKLLKPAAIQKSIDLMVKVRDDVQIMADKAMVSTILRNLIQNAIKFTRPGGCIAIRAEEKDSMMLAEVCDTGIGMDRELAEALFSYDQNTSRPGTKNEAGTGLGLILCKDFISKHNGELWVRSSPDKGSRFLFTLPLA